MSSFSKVILSKHESEGRQGFFVDRGLSGDEWREASDQQPVRSVAPGPESRTPQELILPASPRMSWEADPSTVQP